jgi:hypothetical protein
MSAVDWEIGRRMVEQELRGEARTNFDEQLLELLAILNERAYRITVRKDDPPSTDQQHLVVSSGKPTESKVKDLTKQFGWGRSLMPTNTLFVCATVRRNAKITILYMGIVWMIDRFWSEQR